jgi:CheY-like chemotaxis protein
MSLSKRGLLVVDDLPERRLTVASLLSQAGYSVESVAGGAMAQAMLRARPIELMLLGWPLGKEDALAVCRAIKADPATNRTPVVLVVPRLDEAVRAQGLEAGADELVSFPLEREAFLDLIQQLLHIRDVTLHLDVGVEPLVAALGTGGRRGES